MKTNSAAAKIESIKKPKNSGKKATSGILYCVLLEQAVSLSRQWQ
jgi:hypothetical protein